MKLQFGEVYALVAGPRPLLFRLLVRPFDLAKEERGIVSGRDTGKLFVPLRGETRARFVRVAGDRNTRA